MSEVGERPEGSGAGCARLWGLEPYVSEPPQVSVRLQGTKRCSASCFEGACAPLGDNLAKKNQKKRTLKGAFMALRRGSVGSKLCGVMEEKCPACSWCKLCKCCPGEGYN